MAKKKKPVAKRPTKKTKPVKAALRGKAGAKKPAKAVKAAKKKPGAKRAAPKKKAASPKTAPKRIAPAAKKPVAPVPKKALEPGKPVVPSKPRDAVRPAAVKPKAAPAVKVAAPSRPAPKTAKAAPSPAPTVAPAPKPAAAPVMLVVRPAEHKPLKERVVMEFEVHSNPNVLFELLSTPSGFSEWYCDDVDVHGDVFTFRWGRDEETVTMIGRKAPEVIRFHRADDDDPAAFFEFRIRIDEMTNEVALIVTDHAWPGESGNVRSLWASQIANLTRVLGA